MQDKFMTGRKIDRERIQLFYNGNYSDNDAAYVDEILCDEDCVSELEKIMSTQFDELLPDNDVEKKNLDHILHKIHYNINIAESGRINTSRKSITRWILRLAGVILLPLAIFFSLQKYNSLTPERETWIEINSPAWTRIQFSLPDGTKGWLNSSSSISYSGNFTKKRYVTLKGEAFFDVFKDDENPFTVKAKEIEVKVLGTRFNIASYDNEENVEVVLEEGKLLFTELEQNKTYMMRPNDLVVFDKKEKEFTTEIVQPQKYLSWTDGKLVFRNDPIDVVARRLERWYNVDVEVDVNLSDELRLRATFIDEGLEEVLGLLERSMPVDFKIENREVHADGTYARKKVIITERTN